MHNTQETLNRLKAKAELFKKVGSNYGFVDTETLTSSIFNSLTDQSIGEVTYLIKGTSSGRAKTTKHVLTLHLKGLGVPEGHPTITLVNSFNGEGSLQIRVGFHRLVCSNGLMVGRDYYSDKVRHIKGQKLDTFLQEVDFSVQRAVAWIRQNLVAKIAELKAQGMPLHKQLEVLDKLELSNRIKEDVRRRREQTAWYRQEDSEHNLWNFYNTVNEVIRRNSRSAVAEFNKQSDLMSEIIQLAA